MMTTEWSAFIYEDETRARIAHISGIRYQDDRSPYQPAAASDVPSRKIEVKWQRSLTQGSFSGDGYYPGTIVLNACSIQSAMLKCKEANIKLHPSPVIALPAQTTAITSTCETKLRTRKPTSMTSKSVSSCAVETQLEKPVAARIKSERNESKSSSKKRKKVNKVAKDEVRKSRLIDVFSKVETNPLFDCVKSSKVEQSSATHISSENGAKTERSADTKVEMDSLLHHGTPVKLSSSDHITSENSAKHERSSSSDATTNHEKSVKLSLSEHITPENSAKHEKSFDVTTKVKINLLPNHEKPVKFSSAERITSENSAKHEKSSEVTSKVKKNLLLHNKKPVKLSSAEHITSAKHVRNLDSDFGMKDLEAESNAGGSIKSGSESEHSHDTDSSGRSDSEDSSGGNSEGSDHSTVPMLDEGQSADSEDSFDSDPEDPLSKALDGNVELKAQVKILKTELEDEKRMMVVTNQMRIELQKKVKSLEENVGNLQNEVDVLRKRNDALQDVLLAKESMSHAGPSLKDKDDGNRKNDKRKDRRSHSSNHTSSKKMKPMKDESNPNSPESSVKVHDDSSPYVSPHKPSNKKDKSGPIDFLKDPEINNVCERVQKHLNKSVPMTPDSKGRVNVGYNVKWDVTSFDDIIENNRVNVTKMAQNLAMQTWSKKERVLRSLDGKKSNRFPNAPAKQAATPSKVKAILGAVKAVMKDSGDQEGPSMAFTLKSCRSAIGHKFSNEAFQKNQ